MRKTKKNIIVLLCVSFSCVFYASNVFALSQTNSSADLVIGQADFTHGDPNRVDAGTYEKGMYQPANSFSAGGKFFVADRTNHRVLIYNSIPTSSNASPDVIVGQTNFESVSINQGGAVGANTLYYPQSVYSNGTNLVIADTFNNRVLIFNSIPTANNASADTVIGQADMASNGANRGGTVAANTLKTPYAVHSDGTKLFVADYGNSRALIYNAIGDASAAVAIGQLNKTTATASTAQNRTRAVLDIFYVGGKLIVTDYGSNRVLIFSSVPIADGASANFVVGQSNWTNKTANQGVAVAANSLNFPRSASSDGTKLFVADSSNNRVLVFNSIPAGNNASADFVIGQADFSGSSANQGGSVAANNLYLPTGVRTDGTKLFVSDYSNNRVIIYNSVPSANDASADVVIGQANMTNNVANQRGLAGANTTYHPNKVFSDGIKLFVADMSNNRVLIYNSIPSSLDESADIVIGQQNMNDNSCNQGRTTPAANTLCVPEDVFYNGEKLFITESGGNRRVLIYNSLPTSNNASADVVVGQPNFASNSINQGGVAAANTVRYPTGVFVVGQKLIVADDANHRVQIWNSIPTSNNVGADVVVGQPDMAIVTGGTAADKLLNPNSVCSNGENLVIAENGNHRTVIYNHIPASNGASADVVIGQPDFNSSSANQGGTVGGNTQYYPYEVSTISSRLAIADLGNNRVLIYNSIPSSNNASADVVIGQQNFMSNSANQGGSVAANTMSLPNGAFFSNNKLFAADAKNHRVLIYNLGTRAESLSASSATNSREVSLTLSATDAKDMMISENADFSGASWETYSTTKNLTLSSGDGTKTVYAKFRDYANFEGNTVNQTINLDSELPVIAVGDHKIYQLSLNETVAIKNKTIVFRGKRDDVSKVELYEDGKLKKTSKITKKHNFRLQVKEKGKNQIHAYQFKYYNSNKTLIHTSESYNILFDKLKPKFTYLPKRIQSNPGDTITWQVSDNDQIKYYQYTFRGRKVTTSDNFFTLPTSLPKGQSNLAVRAYDRAGNKAVRRAKVRVR